MGRRNLMFCRFRGTLTLAILIALCGSSIAAAGDFSGKFHHRHGGDRHHFNARQSISGGDGLPSYVKNNGTYAGGISAVRFKRNGTYFAVDGGILNRGYYRGGSTAGPRLIRVDSKTAGAKCSYEAGVCVIRP